MKARTLSKREGEEVITIIRKSWPKDIELGKAKGIKSIECDEDTQILILERIKAIKTNEGVFPFLDQKETLENFPKIEVDLGAIKYVCNGADVMRPGIKIFKDEFKLDLILSIVFNSWVIPSSAKNSVCNGTTSSSDATNAIIVKRLNDGGQSISI